LPDAFHAMLTLVQHFFKDASDFLERGIGFCATHRARFTCGSLPSAI
jgi:hypothetical protein